MAHLVHMVHMLNGETVEIDLYGCSFWRVIHYTREIVSNPYFLFSRDNVDYILYRIFDGPDCWLVEVASGMVEFPNLFIEIDAWQAGAIFHHTRQFPPRKLVEQLRNPKRVAIAPGRSQTLAEMLRVDHPGWGNPIALLEFMENRSSATFHEIGRQVHGDSGNVETSPAAIRQNLKVVNKYLREKSLPILTQFESGADHVIKKEKPR